MGSTGSKNRQIMPAEVSNGRRVRRQASGPQFEVYGRRMSPKAKIIVAMTTVTTQQPSSDVNSNDTSLSPKKGIVAKRTPARQRATVAGAKQTRSPGKPSSDGGRKEVGDNESQANGRKVAAVETITPSRHRAVAGEPHQQQQKRPHQPHQNAAAVNSVQKSPPARHSSTNNHRSPPANHRKPSISGFEDVHVSATGRRPSMGGPGSRQSRAGSRHSRRQDEMLSIKKLPLFDTPESCKAGAKRLKMLLKKLKRDEVVSRDDLIKNIQYIAKVVDAAYKRESSRLYDEEEELSEVTDSDQVPHQVKDWLTSTFTRSLTSMRRRGEHQLHFRSVANAIRAGIVVDRLYRRMSSSAGMHVPPNVLLMMKNLDAWDFDVFQVNEIGEGHSLKYVGYELLQKYHLINKFKINTQTLDNFLARMEQGYSKNGNPYHNLIHAADVTQTTHAIIAESGLSIWLSEVEIFAVLIAALIHDYEHTGTTNAFHVNTSSEVALMYNDKAVLENHHVSAAFRVMREDNHNILSSLKKEEYKDFRSLVIEIVLSTDMSFHFQQIKNMKGLLALPDPSIDKAKALSLIVHCADISHPAKSWHLHLRWTEQLVEEFFRQGDQEVSLGLPISPLCDRKNAHIADSQIGFIDFIVDPSFQVMGDMIDRIMGPIQVSKPDADGITVVPAVDDHHGSTTAAGGSGHGDESSTVDGRGDVDSLNSSTSSLRSSPKPNKEAEAAGGDGKPAAAAPSHGDEHDHGGHGNDHETKNSDDNESSSKETATDTANEAGHVQSSVSGSPVTVRPVGSPEQHRGSTEEQATVAPPRDGGRIHSIDYEYETDVTESELALSTACSSPTGSIHEDGDDDDIFDENQKKPSGEL